MANVLIISTEIAKSYPFHYITKPTSTKILNNQKKLIPQITRDCNIAGFLDFSEGSMLYKGLSLIATESFLRWGWRLFLLRFPLFFYRDFTGNDVFYMLLNVLERIHAQVVHVSSFPCILTLTIL